jgi:quercetin 2,3-dioxygenase
MKLVSKPSAPVSGPVVERMSARTSDVGGLQVRRLLPNTRRTLGAWCFLDHFGPAELAPGAMQVPPHPHIGLQTVTWLLEGEITHLDSLGSHQVIRPGQLNWMTAGAGIAHAEEAVDRPGARVHGVQLWVALPEEARRGPPAFDHHPRVPSLTLGESGSGPISAQLLVGALAGATAAARTFSPLLAAQLDLPAGATLALPVNPDFEHGVAVLDGAVEAEGAVLTVGEIVYLGRQRSSLALSSARGATVLLLGGLPFAEPLLMWWNFVARDDAEIREAHRAWSAGELAPPVVGAGSPPLPAPPLR